MRRGLLFILLLICSITYAEKCSHNFGPWSDPYTSFNDCTKEDGSEGRQFLSCRDHTCKKCGETHSKCKTTSECK